MRHRIKYGKVGSFVPISYFLNDGFQTPSADGDEEIVMVFIVERG